MTTTITVDNLKCGGCANTIVKQLSGVAGVTEVQVEPEASRVTVKYNGPELLDKIKIALKKIGYPETGTTEGIEKITDNLKSYVSCAIGKVTSKSIKTD